MYLVIQEAAMPYKHHNTIRLGRPRHLALFDMKRVFIPVVVGCVAAISFAIYAIVTAK